MVRIRATPEFARGAPFLLFIACLVLGSALSSDAASWLVAARGAIVAAALIWLWPAYGELRKPGPLHAGHWLVAVLAGVAVFAAWVSLDQDWMLLSRSPGFNPRLPEGGIDWLQVVPRFAGFSLVVPLMEELFWRSLVLRWIKRHEFLSLAPRQVGWRAFLITTALFALEHDRWFAGAIAGAVYNGLYMRSGNLWVPVVAHVVTNGVLGVWILHGGHWAYW